MFRCKKSASSSPFPPNPSYKYARVAGPISDFFGDGRQFRNGSFMANVPFGLLLCLTCMSSMAQNIFSPKLNQFLLAHPAVSISLSNAFSQACAGRRVDIYYYYSRDQSGPKGSHRYLEDSSVLGIFVRENQEPVDECISILFEALNSKGENRFKKLFDDARSGAVSRSEFAKEILRQEFQAVKEAKTLIEQFKLSDQETTRSQSYRFFKDTPAKFEDYLNYANKASQGQDQKAYEQMYDAIRATPKSGAQ